MNRREFIGSIGAAALMSAGITKNTQGGEMAEDAIAQWDRETELVAPEEYKAYLIDGNTRGLVSLEKLEKAFDKVMCEVKETVVTGDVPAVWSVYNMGYIVKTRESLFSIDLFHRRAVEFAPLLDFALITHNHGDHWRQDFYDAMDGAGKTVISNFLENSGAKESGLVHGVKTFKIKDVEIRTSLIDHNPKLINFTTAFEIRIGSFILYHTGDSGRGTEPKLETVWGRPDLWLFFPGCGIDTAVAVKKIN
ncbi:MAG: MBL fold metallo-hydrolase, partial [Thermoguttaceae bacterium]